MDPPHFVFVSAEDLLHLGQIVQQQCAALRLDITMACGPDIVRHHRDGRYVDDRHG
jgi:hypothetical protein